MAFRAAPLARHARSLTTHLSRTARHSPIQIPSRVFSFSSVRSLPSTDSTIDELIADVLNTNDRLAAHPPEAPKKSKKAIKEEKDYGTDLPPPGDWNELFPYSTETKARFTLVNPEVCKQLAETFVPEGSKDKIILEAFPGQGVLTRALLDLPKERIKKLIVMEDYPRYHRFLKPLEKLDSRLTVLSKSGYSWDAYEQMSTLGLLDDVPVVDWSQEHPQLQFISHIPAKVHGEQLVSQFFRSIPGQQWMFKYGRIPLDLIMTDSLWHRISAPTGSTGRCKLSVIAEATSSFNLSLPLETLTPYASNFFPRKTTPKHFVTVNIMPSQEQVIDRGLLDEWDYCLRRMFVQKATPLKNVLPQLAPGAMVLLKKMTADTLPPEERIDVKIPPRQMTAKEWKSLVQAFADWPFKPEDLSIDNFHTSMTKQESKKVM